MPGISFVFFFEAKLLAFNVARCSLTMFLALHPVLHTIASSNYQTL